MNDRLAYYREKYGEDFASSGNEKSSGKQVQKGASQKPGSNAGKEQKSTVDQSARNSQSESESGEKKQGLIGRLGKLLKRTKDVDK